LSGNIKNKDFFNLLDGKHPITEKQLIQFGGENHNHRAGTDIPFSVPKSVSIVGLIPGITKIP